MDRPEPPVAVSEFVLGHQPLGRARADLVYGMVAARLTLEVNLRLAVRAAALAFNPPKQVQEPQSENRLDVLAASIATDIEAAIDKCDDDFGFRWLILRGSDLEELAVSLGVLAEELGRADQLWGPLFAAFAFTDRSNAPNGRQAFWIFNFERGSFYPFVPTTYGDRDTRREAQFASAVDGELKLERDRELWFPVWESPV